jgi:hypothetical protein
VEAVVVGEHPSPFLQREEETWHRLRHSKAVLLYRFRPWWEEDRRVQHRERVEKPSGKEDEEHFPSHLEEVSFGQGLAAVHPFVEVEAVRPFPFRRDQEEEAHLLDRERPVEARTEREWADAGEDHPSCLEEGTSVSEDRLDRPGLGEEDQGDLGQDQVVVGTFHLQNRTNESAYFIPHCTKK